MGLFMKLKAKRELKKQQKEETVDELKCYIYVKDAKIDILEKELQKSRNEYWAVFDKLDEKSHRCEIATLENIMFEQKLEQANQEKISFAVEQLEKVKDYFCIECEDGDGVKTGDWEITKDACDVAEYIDNQIKQLKEGN